MNYNYNYRLGADEVHHIYLDVEFDGIIIERTYHQMLLSIGAVMLDDEGNECSRFYEVIKPYKFKTITKAVKRITRLEDNEILEARSFAQVMDDFIRWCLSYEKERKHIILYSFGPDDRKTMLHNAQVVDYDIEEFITPVLDLQRMLSKTITFQGKPLRKSISLNDALKAYGISSVVAHNALDDSIDLMMVHQAFLNHQQVDEAFIIDLVKRIAEKEIEKRQKARQRLTRMMRKRFGALKESLELDLTNPLLRTELKVFKELDPQFPYRFMKKSVCYEERYYPYASNRMMLVMHLRQPIPTLEIRVFIKRKKTSYVVELNHRNANIIDHIYAFEKSENVEV